MATGGGCDDLNEPSTSADVASADREDNALTKRLFVGDLNWQITKQRLRCYFQRYGTVNHVHVVMDPITKPESGYGFVIFEESSTIDSILKIPRHAVAGHRVEVRRARIRKRIVDDCKVFVGGLVEPITEDDLRAYFSTYGRIEQLLIPNLPFPDGDQQKYAFVVFETKEIAERVYSNKFHVLKNITLTCEKPWPRSERALPTGRDRASRTPTPETLE